MENSPNTAIPAWLREIDHTGDIGITVTAATLEELFARAAWGMFAVLTDMAGVEVRETHRIAVEAADREALLVEWLSELNYLHVTEHVLLSRFTVESIDDRRLTALVGGEPVDPERHTVYTEIKAITYHDLVIEETGTGWQVQVIFDM